MFEPSRLHPISSVIHFVKGLKDAILPLVAIFLFNGGLFSGDINWFSLAITVGVLLFTLIGGITRWLRFTYWIEDGELRIESGFLFKRKRYIPIERIQSLDFSEGVFHRPFHLVKVSVETAGSSGKAEAELTAIKRDAANRLETFIYEYKGGTFKYETMEVEDEGKKPLYQMGMKQIVLLAITSGGAGVVLSGTGVFFSQFSEILPVGALYDQVLNWIKIGFVLVLMAVFFILLIAYGISILLTILRYSNFTVSVYENDLIITSGLLEKKQRTIPLNRIQAVRIDENLLRRMLGFASVSLVSAGGSSFESGEAKKLLLFPLIKKNEVNALLGTVFEDEYVMPDRLVPPPSSSRWRYMFYMSFLIWVAAIPVSYYFYPWGLLSIAVGVWFIFLGWLDFKAAGFRIENKLLTLSGGALIRSTWMIHKKRIQAADIEQSVFSERNHIATIGVSVISGGAIGRVKCRYIYAKDAVKLLHWVKPSRRKQVSNSGNQSVGPE